MIKSLLFALVSLTTSAFAIEGYKDIYIQSDKDIYLHTIYCAKDLNNLNKLKSSVVFTNTKNIEDATYYMKSRGTTYSTTFNHIKGQASSIRIRGILSNGKTSKAQMEKQLCLVEKNPALPKMLNEKITTNIIKKDDDSWNKKMKQYIGYFGQPASDEGKYLSQR